jgi:hypothetical protein
MGIFLLIALSGVLDSIGIQNMQFYIGLGIGAGVGFAQWRVLKSTIGMDKIWLLSSTIGLGLPFLGFDLVRFFTGWSLGNWYIPICILLASALCGLVQQGVLLRMGFRARSWMFVCVAGWTLAAFTVISMDYLKALSTNNWVMFSVNLFLILFGGVVLGFITGLSLRRMLAK